MADEQRLHDLLDLVEHARSEGDKDTEAKAVAAYHREASGTSMPTEAPIASGAFNDGPLKKSSFTQDMLGAGEGLFRGAVEGPGQLVSAVAQAPFDMADAAHTPGLSEFMVPRKPSATILPDYNAAVKARRADTEAAFKRHFGEDTSGIATGIGEFGASLLMAPKGTVPPATTKILSTMATALKGGASAGAVGAATGFQEGADTSGDKALWTAGGGILGAALGLVPAVGGAVQTAFRKYLSGPAVSGAAGAVAELDKAIPGMASELNAGQATGNAGIQKFLSRNAGAQAQEQLLSQTEKLQAHLEQLQRIHGPILPPAEAVAKGQLAMINSRNNMVNARKAIWNTDLDAMRTKVTADTFAEHGIKGTDQVAVELPGLKEGFAEITNDFVNSGGHALSPGFQKIMNEYATFDGHLSFDSLEHLLRLTGGNSGSILKGAGSTETDIAAGKQLKRVVFDAIDKADGQSEIGAMLKQMRAGYAARSKSIDDFESGAAAKVLNVSSGDLVANPEAALASLYKLPEGELGKLSAVLAGSDTAALHSLRSSNIQHAYQEALVADAKPGTPGFDLAKFMNLTTGNGKLRAAGLYSDVDAAVLKNNITAMRALLAKTAQSANTPEVENTAMAGVSRAPAFVARALYRIAAAGNVDKVLFDKAAYKQFQTANTLMQSEKWDEAAYLLGKMASATQQE